MAMHHILGLVLVAVGIALLAFGINATQSVGEEIFETLTGRFTDRTTWFIVGGIAAIVGGVAIAAFGNRS